MGRSIVRSKSESVWRDRVDRANRRPGSMAAFCRAEGVSIQALSYWQSKFRHNDRKSATKPSRTAIARALSASPFVGVEIMEPADRTVRSNSVALDAKWVADFIRHLMNVEVRS